MSQRPGAVTAAGTGSSVSASTAVTVNAPKAAGAKGAAGDAAAAAAPKDCCKDFCDNIGNFMKSFVQFVLVAAATAGTAFLFITYTSTKGVCASNVPIATLALGVALIVLTATSLLDLSMSMCGSEATKKNPFVVICSGLGLTTLAWGLVLAASAWELYELTSNDLFTKMWIKNGTECNPLLYKGMSIITVSLIGIFIFFGILILIVASIACCCPIKSKPDAVPNCGTKCWGGTLNFFGLDKAMDSLTANATADEKGGKGKKGSAEEKVPLLGKTQ